MSSDRRMPPLALPALVVIVTMAACAANILLNDSLDHGAGMDVWLAGTGNPWQLFINLDLMTGLLLALVWMVWRERRNGLALQVAWALVTLWWGNIVVASYLLVALSEADGRTDAFFYGADRPRVDRLGTPARLVLALLAVGSAIMMIMGLVHSRGAFMPSFGYANGFGTLAYFFGLLALRRPRRKQRLVS